MKVFFRRIHLYLSFAAGLVILIACLTGALLVFEKDIMMAASKERYYVSPASQKLPAAGLVQRVKDAFPGTKVTGIRLYTDPGRSAEVSITAAKKKEGKEAGKAPERQPGFTVFVNPYSGAILEKYSYRESNFYTVFALHRWLLGGEGSVGKYIVGVSTLLFLFILLTGIVLWWPKTRTVLQRRLTVKWGASWKRLNHDLHIVLGFYSAIFLFIMAFTGLAWSFEWFNKSIYTVTGSPMKGPEPPKSAYVAGAKPATFDAVLTAAQAQRPGADFYNLQAPKDSVAPFTVQLLGTGAPHESATDAFYFDQYSAAPLGHLTWKERSLGARVRGTFKPVHTGSIGGTPTRILAFIVCLLGVTFPITGTIMWWNRTRKRRKDGKKVLLTEEIETELE
ncbi:PepSY domain-containing protein [Flaviaesturariibacter flavus]|uniref:PepSY domain-containing protein n=1 Tax=Flaviaesturariibacter flavus TaxID=2502780 RepID=A0A4R1B8R9_9BACT|nr:PepSY-associated TM helix domain-containing protein [Flaviaesturariibacter flavus]TCJ13225.1 PepSY domain-containing protein [Flaviaesturariibacter flavus]